MKILMVTNTYLPHVGGVTNSVSTFTDELRKRGHRVFVVAPEYKDIKNDHPDTIRIPAIQNFNGSDFSVVLPIPKNLDNHLEDFRPDVIHSHHPFLLGTTAVRISSKYQIPLAYTYHTMFEKYTHYVPMDIPRMKEFVVSLSLGYSNIADMVIVPSESVARVLKERKAVTPIEIIPTGIYTDKFRKGNGEKIKNSNNIPKDAFVLGHVGRLAPEKNLNFLSKAVDLFLEKEKKAHFIVAGYGSSEQKLKDFFANKKLKPKVHFTGKLKGQELIDVYHSMDVFVFSSKSETQGLVLTEAMAAGIPVVALNASGVSEVVRDGVNGYLLMNEDIKSFAENIERFFKLSSEDKKTFSLEAQETAGKFSIDNCVSKLESVYENLKQQNGSEQKRDESLWNKSIEQIKTEWDLFTNLTSSVGEAIYHNKQ